MQIYFRSLFVVVLLLSALANSPVYAGEVNIAVSADFSAPMVRIVALFQKESGHTIKVSLGASGKLYAQIKGGTPMDVFLSADEIIPKRLIQEGQAVGSSRFVYAVGKLVLWSAQPGFVDEKGAVLNKGNFTKLAIADTKFDPYGLAAKETLEKLIMWNAMQEKLIKGESISQTYQLAASENAELAFISLSQIMRDGKVTMGSWWIVPPDSHNPIRQSAVLLIGAKDKIAAQAFLDFLKSNKAVAIIRSFGYELP
jgi:molybdate transport system substrate-binding protein